MNFILSLAAAVVIHELGHIFAARLVRVPLVSVGQKLTGLSLVFDFSHVGFFAEEFVHSGGAVFGIISAFAAALTNARSLYAFTGISLTLAAVNLLPLSSFDGGAILSSILSAFFLPDTVWRITKTVSAVTLVILWTSVLWTELRVGANLGLIVFVCGIMIYLTEKT